MIAAAGSPPQLPGKEWRADIQALRGWAVLLVLFEHSQLLSLLRAGWLGVDMFFVVSGYLITGILQRSIQAQTFSTADFYFRRAKRLLPAAYVTFAVAVALSPFLLTQQELRDFAMQVLGAVTFTGNIVLWMQTGYFEAAAAYKPLMHLWSLGIEEQFYLLVPVILLRVPARFWKAATGAVVMGSLLLCLLSVSAEPDAAFYGLPTRAWELGLGSLGSLVSVWLEGSAVYRWIGRAFWLAVAALVLLPFFPTGLPHPGLDALLVCLATLVVILHRHERLGSHRVTRSLAWFGDLSYSLYLVHGVLFSFAAAAIVVPVPTGARWALVAASVGLAFLLNRGIEVPIRRWEPRRRWPLIAALLGATCLLVAGAMVLAHRVDVSDTKDFAHIRRVNFGLDISCEFESKFDERPACRTAPMPRILIWGDSFAMHLVDGIVASTSMSVGQATMSVCGPLLDVSSYTESGYYNAQWARACLGFSRSVLDYLAHAPDVEVVVLSSQLLQYLEGNNLLVTPADAGTIQKLEGNLDIAAAALQKTIGAVRKLGKRVVLVAPPPASGFDIGRCLELRATGAMAIGADYDDCRLSVQRYRSDRADVLRLLDRVESESGVPVIRLDEHLCDPESCRTKVGESLIYRDSGHLSHEGSRWLGQDMQLGRRILESAR